MKIKLNEFIKEMGGKDTELTIGKALANIVLMEKTDPLRAFVLAKDLYTLDEIELSKGDFEWVKKIVTEKGCEFYPNSLVAGQLLVMFSDLKKE